MTTCWDTDICRRVHNQRTFCDIKEGDCGGFENMKTIMDNNSKCHVCVQISYHIWVVSLHMWVHGHQLIAITKLDTYNLLRFYLPNFDKISVLCNSPWSKAIRLSDFCFFCVSMIKIRILKLYTKHHRNSIQNSTKRVYQSAHFNLSECNFSVFIWNKTGTRQCTRAVWSTLQYTEVH